MLLDTTLATRKQDAMPNRRLSVKSIREILRLAFACHLSGRQIAQSLGLSRAAVQECLRRTKAAGLAWPLPTEIDDAALIDLLYKQTVPTSRTKPDCEYIHRELKRKGVTLSLLWEEYKREHPDGYQYTQFCDCYRDWRKMTNLTMRQEHKAGKNVFSDFSGGTLDVVDLETGEVRKARLFVCALGASNFTYAEPFYSESAESWCTGQSNAFLYYNGCPEICVPDNPKAVIVHACPYEPDINPDFLLMAEYYGIAVLPARVRKPRDKAKVEAAVLVATRWILARLRNRRFLGLAEAKDAVRKLVDQLNDRQFKKMKGTRRSLFEAIEQPALTPLPAGRYEYTHVAKATVDNSYHIEIGDRAFSVPFHLAGKVVEARITHQTVEIFFNHRRVASHVVDERSKCTLPEHMPKSHRAYAEWSPVRMKNWASKVGPQTASFVEQILLHSKPIEKGYRSCFGIMRLAKLHGNERMEGACLRAASINSFSYKTVKLILQNNMECRPVPKEHPQQLKVLHSNIRGADYYSKEEQNHVDSPHSGQPEDPETPRDGEGIREATSNT
jgi:transposase